MNDFNIEELVQQAARGGVKIRMKRWHEQGGFLGSGTFLQLTIRTPTERYSTRQFISDVAMVQAAGDVEMYHWKRMWDDLNSIYLDEVRRIEMEQK